MRTLLNMIFLFTLLYGTDLMGAEKKDSAELLLLYGKTSGSGNLDGPLDIASFSHPQGIAVDKHGNIFVTDAGPKEEKPNNTIRKITPQGIVSTFAGQAGQHGSTDGRGADARFSGPTGIVIDSDGNIFVADSANNVIRKITPDAMVSTFIGSGAYGYEDGAGTDAELFYPKLLAIDGANNIYLAGKTYIRKITPDGVVNTFAGANDDSVIESIDGSRTTARFVLISGIAADVQGNIYVSDWYSIRKISVDGSVTTLAGDQRGDSRDGTGKDAIFNSPGSLSVDRNGNIFVFDSGNMIRKVTADGVVTTIAGSPSNPNGDTDGKEAGVRFGGRGLALTAAADGNIYFADAANNSIRKISTDGEVTKLAGGAKHGAYYKEGDENPNFMFGIASIACSSHGTVFVANQREIYKIDPNGMTEIPSHNFSYLERIRANAHGELFVINGPSMSSFYNSGRGGSEYSMVPRWMRDISDTLFPERRHHDLYKISADGKKQKLAGKLENISSIALDNNNELYGSNYSTVFKIEPGKFFSAHAKNLLKPANSRKTDRAKNLNSELIVGIAVDQFKNIYINDLHSIKKISPQGDVTTLAGSGKRGIRDGQGQEAEFDTPRDLTIDARGNLYVVETKSHIVRKITPDGLVSTFVGRNGVSGFSGGSLPGTLSEPIALSVCENSLYILMQDGTVALVKNIY